MHATRIERIDVPLDPELIGTPIRLSRAAEKYGVSTQNLSRWSQAGLIAILEEGPKLVSLDEAHVKRAVAIFRLAKRRTSPRRAGWILKSSLAE